MITVDRTYPIKVLFLKPISEEDFPERGMTAWLTDVFWEDDYKGYNLSFDFTEFEEENENYLPEVYYPNIYTISLPYKERYTAKEAGIYSNKYSVYFYLKNNIRDDEQFAIEIQRYLRIIK